MPPVRARRVRALRRRLNLSQAQLASRSGGVLNQAEICHAETGRNKVATVRMLRALATAFGITPDLLDSYLHGRIPISRFHAEVKETKKLIINLKGTVTCEWCGEHCDVTVPMEIKPDGSYTIKRPDMGEGKPVRRRDDYEYCCKACYSKHFSDDFDPNVGY